MIKQNQRLHYLSWLHHDSVSTIQSINHGPFVTNHVYRCAPRSLETLAPLDCSVSWEEHYTDYDKDIHVQL